MAKPYETPIMPTPGVNVLPNSNFTPDSNGAPVDWGMYGLSGMTPPDTVLGPHWNDNDSIIHPETVDHHVVSLDGYYTNQSFGLFWPAAANSLTQIDANSWGAGVKGLQFDDPFGGGDFNAGLQNGFACKQAFYMQQGDTWRVTFDWNMKTNTSRNKIKVGFEQCSTSASGIGDGIFWLPSQTSTGQNDHMTYDQTFTFSCVDPITGAPWSTTPGIQLPVVTIMVIAVESGLNIDCTMHFREGINLHLINYVTCPPTPPIQANWSFDNQPLFSLGGIFFNNSTSPYAIVSNHWTFGDGTTSSASQPTHVYAVAGTYSVTLTVQDSMGRTASFTDTVTVPTPQAPPPPPPPGSGNPTGYSWPAAPALSGVHALRCDENGDPKLFLSWPVVAQNPGNVTGDGAGVLDAPVPNGSNGPWLDYAMEYTEGTVRMFDIAGGTPTQLQTITPDLLPTADEVGFHYGSALDGAPIASNAMYAGLFGYWNDLQTAGGSGEFGTIDFYAVVDRGFALSTAYDDPLLGGDEVFLITPPWVNNDPTSISPQNLAFRMRAVHRVRSDGSTAFDYLDGLRQLDFSIMPESAISVRPGPGGGWAGVFWGSGDFFSDPRDIWLPLGATGATFGVDQNYGAQYDRICGNVWAPYHLVGSPTNPDGSPYVPIRWLAGFYYDPTADTISYSAFPSDLTSAGFDSIGSFCIATLHICRGCVPCNCAPTGMHTWHTV